MTRSRRQHLPGVPFHITARLQGRVSLFRGIEPLVVRYILEHAERAGGGLLGYAVMPTHLHLIYVQGQKPLAALMQPLLRQLAVRVHQRGRSRGHVFERRYHSSACRDADYLRTAILYVHLNPVTAGICVAPELYPWTSHGEYMSASAAHLDALVGVTSGLCLFAKNSDASVAELRQQYGAVLASVNQARSGLRVSQSRCCGGDDYWKRHFAAACEHAPSHMERQRIDLRDLALATLRDVAPDMPLDVLRSGGRGRALVVVRRRFIHRARQGGHRGTTIARFLNVSDTTVSNN